MDIIENHINELVKSFKASPYLFIGSGFSRRYLNLEDWEGLLRKFCNHINPYEYYKSTHNNNLPEIASAMCKDFNQMVWNSNDSDLIAFVKNNQSKLVNNCSALKISISDYLKEIGIAQAVPQYVEEIENFKKVTIEGIITTNWDNLLIDLFPNFQSVIGQDGLVSSGSFGIGEIFKIHGCSSVAESLILTAEDYHDFNKRNAYLAAKLVTYFVEHPVIFIGYSLTDENVTEILSSIINCLGKSSIEKLSNNFIFVQRAREKEQIKFSYKDIGGTQIPIIIFELLDYSKLYRPLASIKRQLPVRLLRYLREQLYEFVHSNEPKGQVQVIDFQGLDESSELNKIEVVVGIGLLKKLGQIGYDQIKPADIIEEFLFENRDFDARLLIEKTIPNLQKSFLPIHKFIGKVNKYEISTLLKTAKVNYEHTESDFQIAKSKKQFQTNYSTLSFKQLIALDDKTLVMRMICFYQFTNKDELLEFKEYLKSRFNEFFKDSIDIGKSKTTYFRKAVAYYDFLKYKKSN